MVRPKVSEPKQQFTLMLKPSVVEEIDRFAKKAEVSRSQFMANLIEMGLDDARILDKLGLIKAVNAGRKVVNSILSKFQETKA